MVLSLDIDVQVFLNFLWDVWYIESPVATFGRLIDKYYSQKHCLLPIMAVFMLCQLFIFQLHISYISPNKTFPSIYVVYMNSDTDCRSMK